MTAACPSCAAPTAPTDRFCESCGNPLSGPDIPAAGGVWRSSRAAGGGPCAGCGGVVGDDAYCEDCGLRRGAGLDRAEDDLPGVAAVTDKGLRKGRNEDAYAIGVAGGRRAVVVCDGVSSAPDSDLAATTAVDEAIAVLLGGGDIPAAYRAASDAVAELAGPGDRFDAPACTFLAAVVEDGEATVGWVGDSRAYWLDGAGARCLTVDDSLAGQLAAAGIDAGALRLSAQAAALTRWLGADAPAGDPHLVTLRPGTAGILLLVSDGLTRYATWSEELLLVTDGLTPYTTWSDGIEGAAGAPELARRLTDFARDAGGADNITVTAVPFEPSRGEPRP
ncbi:protein phosphatase 2C domain-containing protein [Dactylosporangium sp. NPDC005555]|uniref:PP2C family serine/threonine-protein phosphatase n=1 Tax=Dactylosporangium sp. NPDC005555 TaxID=3154889 RepID=UPI0033AE5B24